MTDLMIVWYEVHYSIYFPHHFIIIIVTTYYHPSPYPQLDIMQP
jgi:hypothetical protein